MPGTATETNNASIRTKDLLRQLQWRYAVKKFDPSLKIAPDLWQTLEEACLSHPHLLGLQPWKFFVVKNPELRRNFKRWPGTNLRSWMRRTWSFLPPRKILMQTMCAGLFL